MEQQVTEQPINDVAQMGSTVVEWFKNRHQQLTHLRNTPEHDELEIIDQDTGEVFKMNAEQRKAFIMGVAVAQTIFVELPFRVVSDDEEQPTD